MSELGNREEHLAIGADLGASILKLGLVNGEGRVVRWATQPTIRSAEAREFLDWWTAKVGSFVEEVRTDYGKAPGIGFAVPLYVEGPDWIQRATGSLPWLEGSALRKPLTDALPTARAMANDATAAVVAEYLYGQGQGADRLLLIAIGTGIALGMIVNGRLVNYSWGSVGDAGHIIVDTHGLQRCACGGRGCLDGVASGLGIRQAALNEIEAGRETSLSFLREAKGDLSAKDVAAAARQGDRVARDVLNRAAFFLGAGLASYLHMFRPDRIVLCGGLMSGASDLLLEPMRESLEQLANPFYLSRLNQIVVSDFPDQAASIGAACLVLYPERFPIEGVHT
jgi:glucokinase